MHVEASEYQAELDRRIGEMENVDNLGGQFDSKDWLWLFILGIAFPAVALIWGVL